MRLENIDIEFKCEFTENVKKTVVAFANSNGGTIYMGLNDDGTVCGVNNPDDQLLKVTNQIRDSISPDVTLFTESQIELMEGKSIIVVKVHRGTARPYYLKGKGIRPEGVYVRHGASTVPASEAAIIKMIKETSGDCFETARSINQQLTFEKTEDYFMKKNIEFEDIQKRTLNIIGEDGTFTNLALLLSDQCTHTIKLAIFEGSQKTVFQDRYEFTGSLINQLEEGFKIINRYNRTRSEFGELERIDMRDYPPEAIREALLNAIIHRDYAFKDATLISIFDDRIEMVTIGGLVKGISYDDIRLGVSALRNRYLADVFYRLKLIEAYGTGIAKIYHGYKPFQSTPQIDITSNAFKITLPNTNYKRQANYVYEETVPISTSTSILTQREKDVISLFEKTNLITRKEIQEALLISQATAITLIREMIEKGILIKEGSGKFLKYKMKNRN